MRASDLKLLCVFFLHCCWGRIYPNHQQVRISPAQTRQTCRSPVSPRWSLPPCLPLLFRTGSVSINTRLDAVYTEALTPGTQVKLSSARVYASPERTRAKHASRLAGVGAPGAICSPSASHLPFPGVSLVGEGSHHYPHWWASRIRTFYCWRGCFGVRAGGRNPGGTRRRVGYVLRFAFVNIPLLLF